MNYSNSESDDEVMIVDPPSVSPGSVSVKTEAISPQILTIDEDDEDNENGPGVNGSTPESTPSDTSTSTPTRRVKRHIQNTVSYAEFFSDDEEEEKIKKIKSEKDLKDHTKNIDFLPDCISELTCYPKLAKTYQNLRFGKSDIINMDDYVSLFQACGKFVQRISLETVNLQLLKQISASCPNLKILAIQKSTHDEKFTTTCSTSTTTQSRNQEFMFSQNLEELDLSANNFITNNPEHFKIFFSACRGIETFQYNFTTLVDLNLILRTLKATKLKQLTSLTLCHKDEETLGLEKDQIKEITSLDLKKLKTLHLNCGLYENVGKTEFEGLLKSYAVTLESFTLAGNYYGTDNIKMNFSIEIPKMNKLNSISIGSVYAFEALDQFEGRTNGSMAGGANAATRDLNEPISLADQSLISIRVSFPHIMPKLDKLILGNLFKLDQLHPQTFPNLSVFRVGSAWSTSIEIPTNSSTRKFPVFPSMRELQLPDFIRDEYFVQQINTIFPNLRKAWINIPSSKCLYLFLKNMSGSNLKHFFIKTQYDFSGMLEKSLVSPLKGKGRRRQEQNQDQPGPSRKSNSGYASSLDLELLLKYKNPEIDDDKYFKDFINYYNIELPMEESLEPIGISNLKNLNVLQIVHIPRKLKIPLNNKLPHHHRDQTFHPKVFIGFTKYPLVKEFFKEEIKKMPNLEKLNHDNIKVPCSYILPTMVKYSGSGNYRSDKDSSVLDDSDDDVTTNWSDSISKSPKSKKLLKVKIPPSLAATQTFKMKKEKQRDTMPHFAEGDGPNLAVNILWNIEVPLKLEKE